MTTLFLCPMVRFSERNSSGAPLVGGKVYTAQVGTVAGPSQAFPKVTYSDGVGTVPNTNPVILDGAGRADIYLNGSYSIAIYDANGVLVESNPNVFGTGSGAPVPATGIDAITFIDASLSAVNVPIIAANNILANPMVIIKTDSSPNPVVIVPTSGTILGAVDYSMTNQNEAVRLVPQSSTNDWKKGA